ncbi:MAG: hypothetical protein MZU91_00690 [Desulfosudis oleivorans]|nr:hypothetical protein [Desulfosudis oleivorans]
MRTYLANCAYSTHDDFNPNYIKPNGMMYRMMKATHEYGAGTATFYMTTNKNARDRHGNAADDARGLREAGRRRSARADARPGRSIHRIWTVESHLRHIQFRKETRYPGFYYRGGSSGPGRQELVLLRQLQVRSQGRQVGCVQERLHQAHPVSMDCVVSQRISR